MSLVLQILASLTVGVATIVVIIWWKYLRVPSTTIPSPPVTPLLGNVSAVKKASQTWTMHSFIVNMNEKYGKIVALRLPGRLIVTISDPTTISHILKRPRHFGRSKFFKAAFAHIAKGLLILEGDTWQRHRRLLQPVFHARSLKGIVVATNDACTKLFAGINTHYANGTSIPMESMFALVSMDVIGKVGFGLEFGCVENALPKSSGGDSAGDTRGVRDATLMQQAVDRLFRGVEIRIPVPKFAWRFLGDNEVYEEARTYVRNYLTNVLQRARSRPSNPMSATTNDATPSSCSGKTAPNLLRLMLAAQEGDDDAKRKVAKLSDEEIVDELIMFFLAGHETTSTTLTWLVVYVTQHPSVLHTMIEEVERVVGKEGSLPTFDHLKELRFTMAVYLETLRLQPVAPFTARRAINDCVLMGHHIPAETVCFTNFRAVHLDDRVWPEASTFNPYRWMPDPAATLASAKDKFFAFSVGPQSCIGKEFAQIEMKVVLVRLCQWLAAMHRQREAGTAESPAIPKYMKLSQPQAHGDPSGEGDPTRWSVATITAKPDGGVLVDV